MLLLSSIVTPNTICSCYIVAGSLVLESYKPAQSLDCEIKRCFVSNCSLWAGISVGLLEKGQLCVRVGGS